ncbi:MAG: hypothetical protein AAFZ15_33195 [Bacteroidota bacterium]
MYALKDLMHLVTRHKRKELSIIGYDMADNNYELFYHKIEKGDFATDDDAAAYFFGPDKNGQYTQYKNLKNRFFRRLTNAVFHLDLKKPEFNEAQVGFYNCWKNLASVKIMGARGAMHAAERLAKITLRASEKFEVVGVTLELARVLRTYYTYYKPDNRKRNHYEEILNKSLEAYQLEVRSESMYTSLIAPYILSRSRKPWICERANACLQELAPHFGKIQSYRFNFYYYLIKRLECEVRFDYPGVVEVSREALEHFKKKDSTPKTTFAIFGNSLLIGLTMIGEHEEAEQVAGTSLTMVEKYSVGWYKTNEMYMTLKLYKKDYQEACTILNKAVHHRRFKNLPPAERESWKIYEGFLQLLILAKKIKQTDGDKKRSKFRPARFLNEVPNFSKDKRGMNIPVLITHIIYLLYEKRYVESYDRMLALEKYNSRHLKEGDDTFRTYCFIKALLQIQKADFKRSESEKRATGCLARMSSQPVQYLNAPHEVETIPYEHLWELAMEAISQ